MDHKKTPLFDALLNYTEQQTHSFHVPGHKDGLVFPDKGKMVFKELLAIDGTEVEGLDDLYQSTGPIREAQDLLSDYYGANQSYFLVNGSTVGNLTMVLSACKVGEKVLVQRNSHKSIFNALKMARTVPIFLSPKVDSKTRIPVGIDYDTLSEALLAHPDVKVLILTHPNYYGMAANYENVIQLAHKHGLIVLVDEAHGAHFKLGYPLPKSAIDMGADMVVQSAHKTLPVMTMGSFLHLKSHTLFGEKVEEVLGALQTSSPSYPIMASLDLARYYLATMPKKQINQILFKVSSFAEGLATIPQLRVICGDSQLYQMDPFKIILQAPDGVSGYELQKRLVATGIYPELADPDHVLLVLAIGDTMDYAPVVDKIKKSLSDLPTGKKMFPEERLLSPKISSLTLLYDEIDHILEKDILIEESAGYVSAETIMPYPPGVPLILQGERLTNLSIQTIKHWKQAGARFQKSGAIQFDKIKVYNIEV